MKDYQPLKQVVFSRSKEIRQLPAGTRIHIFGDGTTYEVVADGIRIWEPKAFIQHYIIRFESGFGLYDYREFYLLQKLDGTCI